MSKREPGTLDVGGIDYIRFYLYMQYEYTYKILEFTYWNNSVDYEGVFIYLPRIKENDLST